MRITLKVSLARKYYKITLNAEILLEIRCKSSFAKYLRVHKIMFLWQLHCISLFF